MNRKADTQKSPFLAGPGCEQGYIGCWVTRNPFLHICSSGVQYLVHADTPQGNPWSCSKLAPPPSLSSTALSIRNSGEDGQTRLSGKQMARHHPSRFPGTGFCNFGWRNKYSQLCLFPAYGLFCRGKHQELVSKLPGMSVLPQSATCPSQPRQSSTAHPVCLWSNKGT